MNCKHIWRIFDLIEKDIRFKCGVCDRIVSINKKRFENNILNIHRGAIKKMDRLVPVEHTDYAFGKIKEAQMEGVNIKVVDALRGLVYAIEELKKG